MIEDNFTVKKVGGAETVGDIFHETRKRRGINLEEVSRNLRIQKKYLENLEEGEYDKLPADVYTRGFIKSYAEYLELDFNQIEEMYGREKNIIKNIKGDKGKIEQVDKVKKASFTITPKLVKVSVIVLMICGLFLYLWLQISGLSSSPRLIVTEPNSDITINDTNIIVIGETREGADVKINEQNVYVDNEGSFKESVGLQEGLNTLIIVATNKLGKETIVERKIQVNIDRPEKAESKDDEEINEDSDDVTEE